ncbi:hypothetical protein MNBD_PLANCTO03-584, partial [hydrothermal vent metagenome]
MVSRLVRAVGSVAGWKAHAPVCKVAGWKAH